MDKVSYEQLCVELEKLYSNTMNRYPNITDDQIADNCELVEALITASGWTVDEYYDRFLQDDWSDLPTLDPTLDNENESGYVEEMTADLSKN